MSGVSVETWMGGCCAARGMWCRLQGMDATCRCCRAAAAAVCSGSGSHALLAWQGYVAAASKSAHSALHGMCLHADGSYLLHGAWCPPSLLVLLNAHSIHLPTAQHTSCSQPPHLICCNCHTTTQCHSLLLSLPCPSRFHRREEVEQALRVSRNSAELLNEMLAPIKATGDRSSLQEPFVADLVDQCYRCGLGV